MLAFAVISPQERPDPAGALVLGLFPVAFGLAGLAAVHLHRQSQRDAFVERVDRAISTRLTGSGAPGQTIPPSAPAPPSDAANALRIQIVVGVVIALAIGLLIYMLPHLYH